MNEETTIVGIKKISVKTDFNLEDHVTKRSLSVNVEVTEGEANAILELTKGTGSWYLVIGVEARQLPLPPDGTTAEAVEAPIV